MQPFYRRSSMLRAVALFLIVLGLMGMVADSSVLSAQELLTVCQQPT